MDKNLFTVNALAKKSGYWVGSLNRWVREGKLTPHRVNNKLAIDYDEFQKFLVNNNIKKPYKKKPRVMVNKPVVPEEQKVPEMTSVSDKELFMKKLDEALKIAFNSHILTPKQFSSLAGVYMELQIE